MLNYLIPTLPGKLQRAVYLWRLTYRQRCLPRDGLGPSVKLPGSDSAWLVSESSRPTEAQIPPTDVYQGLAWAFVLNYLVPTLPGKFQTAVYPWRLRYRQLMSTKVWPGPLCWTTWFLLFLVRFREQYTHGSSDTDNWCLPRSGLGLCVELPRSYSAWSVIDNSIPMEAQIPATVYQGQALAFALNYLVPILPGKLQRAVYLWRRSYRQLMSTNVYPRPMCWNTWFLLCLVSFRQQYTYGG